MGYLENFKVVDEIAIVTGGSKGLGRAMALGLAECGAKVVVASRTVSLIEETANEIIKNGGEAIAVPVDVKNPQSIEQMVAQVVDRYGRVDILINNAGIAPMKKTMETDIEDWNDVLNTNLKSAFLVSKAVARSMIRQRRGKIINMGSVLGHMVSGVSMPYCVSKAGIAHMTKALALEWAPYGLNINCIAPGYFETEMTAETREDESHLKFLKFKIPFKRFGKPEEIVGAVLFLASSASDYVTGAVLYIDGGYSIW
jgi:NAD(P)-dependent dehydrogenase (short-subunit alcohol dehydrogenase family)